VLPNTSKWIGAKNGLYFLELLILIFLDKLLFKVALLDSVFVFFFGELVKEDAFVFF
jgi:hypothetical protein